MRLSTLKSLTSPVVTANGVSSDYVASLYSRSGKFQKALSASHTLSRDPTSIFVNITERCLAQDKSQEGNFYLETVLSPVEMVSGTPASRAWLFLEKSLENYGQSQHYRAVLQTILQAESSCLPPWLVSYFRVNFLPFVKSSRDHFANGICRKMIQRSSADRFLKKATS